jgi:carbohydrate diacid regulator
VEADRQARMARTLGAALTGPGLHRYQQLAIYDSLLGELDGPRAARIHERTLARLSPELARTLELYLQTGSSVAATARALFVHRNTVHYRLHRIEAETGLQLDRLEHRMLCELALLADRIGAPAAP